MFKTVICKTLHSSLKKLEIKTSDVVVVAQFYYLRTSLAR